MTDILRSAVLACALVVTPFSTHAEDSYEAKMAEGGFERLDTDHDGSINRSEFNAFIKSYLASLKAEFHASFAEIDVDGNGSVDRAEASVDKVLLDSFSMVDTNGDGMISKQELAQAMRATVGIAEQ